MQKEVDRLRQVILSALPQGSIIPCHDNNGHHYQLAFAPSSPIVDSVTTKGGILDKKYLQPWAVKLAIDHIRENWPRAKSSDAERELVFMDAQASHKDTLNDAGNIGTEIHAVIERYLNDWIVKKRRPDDITAYMIVAANGQHDPRLISGIRAAEKFCIDNEIVPVYSELLVGSIKNKVAGTLDLLAFVAVEPPSVSQTVFENSDVYTNDVIKMSAHMLDEEIRKHFCKPGQHQYWEIGQRHECMKCGKKVRFELTLVDWKSSNSIDKPEYMMQTATYWECLKENTGIKPRGITIVQLSKTNGEYATLSIDEKKRREAFKAYMSLTKTYDWLNSEHSDFKSVPRKVLKI